MNLLIQVTKTDIEQGVKQNCIVCPVALAINRQVPFRRGIIAGVGIEKVILWKNGNQLTRISLPEPIPEFIAQFDDYIVGEKPSVQPIEFYLSVEEKYLA